MTRTISFITAVAVVALTFSVPRALGKGWPTDWQEPPSVGTYPDQYKRTVARSSSVTRPGQPGLAGASSDFWNYDVRTGQRMTNTSPGVAPQDLAALYSPTGEGVSPQTLDAREEAFAIKRAPQPISERLSSSREDEWPSVGIGLAIGTLLMICLFVAVKGTRRGPLPH